MPRSPGPIRPRSTHAREYERRLRREILDPLFLDLQMGLAQAGSADQAYRALNGAVAGAAVRGVDPELVTSWLQRVDNYSRARLIQTYRSALGVDVTRLLTEPEIASWMSRKLDENVALIKTIPPRMRDGFRRRLEAELREAPFDRARLTQILQAEYKSSGYNCRRLARDQTSKSTSQLTEIRQRQLGVTHYQWSTSKDERVRPTHRANEGRIFEWANPPPETGPPGADVMCRCVAKPQVTREQRQRVISAATQQTW